MRPVPSRAARSRTAVGTALAVAALAAVSACGSSSSTGSAAPASAGASAGGGGGASAKVAFLMPDTASTRYELYDAPLFKAKMQQLCSGCEVLYQNAGGDASKQQQQANSVLAQGAKVLVIDSVDSAAAATIVQTAQSQGVKVVAYDRPIPKKKADFYISFDNEKIGALIAQDLVDHLTKTGAKGGLLEVNGSPTDAAAGLIKKGVHSVTDSSAFPLLAEFDTPEWKPVNAQNWVSGQITPFKGKVAGIVAANDGTAGGAIAAYKAAGEKVPPVTGNDAEAAAAQRIINGDQYNTISKPIKTVAEAAAETAYSFVQGQTPAGEVQLFDTPSKLFTPQVVTQANIKQVLLSAGGPLKVSEVCTSTYAAACTKLGIQ